MANTLDKLSALAIKSAGEGKHFDGGGPFLDVKANGARYWRLMYRYATREKLLAFGTYPEVSLAEARRKRDIARALIRDGKDPGAERQAAKLALRQDKEAAFP